MKLFDVIFFVLFPKSPQIHRGFKLLETFRTFRSSRTFYQKKRKNENKRNILELMSHYDILCKVIVTCRTESRS